MLERLTKRESKWIGFLVVCVAMLFTPALTFAQDGESKEGEEEAEEKVDAGAEFRRANNLASRNALTRSIPHYKKVIEAAPDQYPLAHFNLGEVYRVKEDYRPAVLAYYSYLVVGSDEQSLDEARDAIDECIAKSGGHSGELTLDITPEARSKIVVDGFVLARGADIKKLALLPGEYEVEVEADEHYPKSKSVEIGKGETTDVSVSLKKKTFYGTLELDIDQDDATVKVSKLELDAPDSPETPDSPGFETTSPVKEAKKLPTGKYFLEVTKEGFNRWIRNIYVKKDQVTTVDIDMTRSLPEEIRTD